MFRSMNGGRTVVRVSHVFEEEDTVVYTNRTIQMGEQVILKIVKTDGPSQESSLQLGFKSVPDDSDNPLDCTHIPIMRQGYATFIEIPFGIVAGDCLILYRETNQMFIVGINDLKSDSIDLECEADNPVLYLSLDGSVTQVDIFQVTSLFGGEVVPLLFLHDVTTMSEPQPLTKHVKSSGDHSTNTFIDLNYPNMKLSNNGTCLTKFVTRGPIIAYLTNRLATGDSISFQVNKILNFPNDSCSKAQKEKTAIIVGITICTAEKITSEPGHLRNVCGSFCQSKRSWAFTGFDKRFVEGDIITIRNSEKSPMEIYVNGIPKRQQIDHIDWTKGGISVLPFVELIGLIYEVQVVKDPHLWEEGNSYEQNVPIEFLPKFVSLPFENIKISENKLIAGKLSKEGDQSTVYLNKSIKKGEFVSFRVHRTLPERDNTCRYVGGGSEYLESLHLGVTGCTIQEIMANPNHQKGPCTTYCHVGHRSYSHGFGRRFRNDEIISFRFTDDTPMDIIINGHRWARKFHHNPWTMKQMELRLFIQFTGLVKAVESVQNPPYLAMFIRSHNTPLEYTTSRNRFESKNNSR